MLTDWVDSLRYAGRSVLTFALAALCLATAWELLSERLRAANGRRARRRGRR